MASGANNASIGATGAERAPVQLSRRLLALGAGAAALTAAGVAAGLILPVPGGEQGGETGVAAPDAAAGGSAPNADRAAQPAPPTGASSNAEATPPAPATATDAPTSNAAAEPPTTDGAAAVASPSGTAATPPASRVGALGSGADGAVANAPAVASPPPRRAAATLPDDVILVTSPRLPLAGIGPDDPERLLQGEVTEWRDLGAALPLRVELLALRGVVPPGAEPVETFADYDALAEALAARPGAVAAVPVSEVDFRVNALLVGEDDPLATAGDGPLLRIGVVGDIVPGRNVYQHMLKYNDFTRPFRDVAPLLRAFDLTVANLEGNLSSTLQQPADPHSFDFVSDPAMLEGFALAGIDAVTLANNHTVWNEIGWGLQGLLDTIASLEAFGLPFFGAGLDLEQARAPWIAGVSSRAGSAAGSASGSTAGGVSVAWLGIDGVTANYEVEPGQETGVVDFDAGATADRPGTNPYLSAQFLADIAAAKERADVVIPYFHMGAEYVGVPPAWAANGARAAIDAGATMVVTNHPHVIQGMEVYNGRPIVYSPGNFILDQMWGVEVRSGYALEIGLRGDRVVRIRCHGTEIEEFHRPRPMTSGEQANLMDRFWASTDRLAARG